MCRTCQPLVTLNHVKHKYWNISNCDLVLVHFANDINDKFQIISMDTDCSYNKKLPLLSWGQFRNINTDQILLLPFSPCDTGIKICFRTTALQCATHSMSVYHLFNFFVSSVIVIIVIMNKSPCSPINVVKKHRSIAHTWERSGNLDLNYFPSIPSSFP